MKRQLLLATAAAFVISGPAAAQARMASGSEDVGLSEVVVTAQKRAENVQSVPISVTAFSAATLKAAGIQDIRDLRRITPALNISTSSQTANTRIQIRGIGTGGNSAVEPSVASFLDGVYIPRIGTLLPGLNDISSVEVLRGPQGTLFGRNASMGALLLRTTEPQRDYSAELTASTGTYGRQRVSAIVNAPINDAMAARLSVLAYKGDGFDRNDITGKRIGRKDGVSVRGSFKWNLNDSLTWLLRGDYVNLSGDGYNTITVVENTVTPLAAANWTTRLDPDGTGPLTGVTPYLTGTYNRHVRQNTDGDLKDYQNGFSSDLTWNLANGYQLKFISSYRDWKDVQYQASAQNMPILIQNRTGLYDSQTHTEELQLLSPETLLDGKLSYVAGLYYFNEAYDIGQIIDLPPAYCDIFIRNTSTAARVTACKAAPQALATRLWFSQDTESVAAYTQATYKLTDKFSFTGGIRYTQDDKSGILKSVQNNPIATQAPEVSPLATKAQKVTYRFNGSYQASDDVMLFASYSTGFKSGGFDSSPPTTAAVGSKNRTFRPETTENIELGIKSEWFERRLIANATLYRTKIQDLQFRSFDGVTFKTQNNGTVQQQGVEFDALARPIPPLTLTLSAAFLDSQYLLFKGAPPLPAFTVAQDLTGQRLPYSPRWQGATSAQYVGHLDNGWTWMARGDLSFVSRQSLASAGDNNPDAMQAPYELLGARIALRGPDERWELALAGQNLTNKGFCTGIFAQPNNAAFGLNNALTGGTVLRCTLNEPQQIDLEAKFRF